MAEIAIIGGAGFIGQYVSRRLAEQGQDVTVLDVKLGRKRRGVRTVSGDAFDEEALRQVLRGKDTVVDLVGLSRHRRVPKESGIVLSPQCRVPGSSPGNGSEHRCPAVRVPFLCRCLRQGGDSPNRRDHSTQSIHHLWVAQADGGTVYEGVPAKLRTSLRDSAAFQCHRRGQRWGHR